MSDYDTFGIDNQVWRHCPHCDEDYLMREDSGDCIICGEDLDEEPQTDLDDDGDNIPTNNH